MINHQNLIKEMTTLKEDLFTANLPDESQIVVNAIKAIHQLLLSVENEKQISLSLSKIISSLVVDVEQKAEAGLIAAKHAREAATSLSDTAKEAKLKVVSLHDTKTGDLS